jgi:transcriptional regulator with XRE-family HTH domain
MKNKIVQNKIEKLVSDKKSGWLQKAEWRRANQVWLDISAKIAVKVLRTIRAKNITQLQLAELMSVSPQQVNKIVKGQENLTLETISKLETALNIALVEVPTYSYKTELISSPILITSSAFKLKESLKLSGKINYTEDWFGKSELSAVHNEDTYSTGTYGR